MIGFMPIIYPDELVYSWFCSILYTQDIQQIKWH